MDQTDAAVWHEVCQLLEDPQRLEQAYRQQLMSSASQDHPEQPAGLDTQLGKLRRGIARLIDSYAEGLIEKPEFEPRVTRMRERLRQLEAQRQQLVEASAVEDELRLILGRLETFAATVKAGLHQADFQKQRDIIRTLVKRVEVDQQHIRVVFRVRPTTLPPASDGAPHTWQHCGGRVHPRALHRHLCASRPLQPVHQTQQLLGHGRKCAHLPHGLAARRGGCQQAGHHRPLVHVKAAAARIHHVHPLSLLSRKRGVVGGAAASEILLCVLAHKRERQTVVPQAASRPNFQASSGAPDPERPCGDDSACPHPTTTSPRQPIPFSCVVVSCRDMRNFQCFEGIDRLTIQTPGGEQVLVLHLTPLHVQVLTLLGAPIGRSII